MEQSRQLERSFVVLDDIPPFGWWDCIQLGLSLTYTTICLRQNISSRCLFFEDQQQKRGKSCISASQISVLARAGLAFNSSTRSLVVRQGQPPPPPPEPVKKKPKRRRSRKVARLGFTRIATRLRHRKKLSSEYKWAAKLSKRLASRGNNAEKAAKPKDPVKPRPPVRLKVDLKLKLKLKRRASGDPGENTKIKKATTGPDKSKIGSYGAIAVFQALRVNRTLLLESNLSSNISVSACRKIMKPNESHLKLVLLTMSVVPVLNCCYRDVLLVSSTSE
ncbi:hypothetical protein V7S43_014634 [Phytophthora oleae]|uniref:Uncharacterized protein n=1 Tax=Phytophthora oleae TaxID=2107226 RepID=A0ABD3F4S7_9STRA